MLRATLLLVQICFIWLLMQSPSFAALCPSAGVCNLPGPKAERVIAPITYHDAPYFAKNEGFDPQPVEIGPVTGSSNEQGFGLVEFKFKRKFDKPITLKPSGSEYVTSTVGPWSLGVFDSGIIKPAFWNQPSTFGFLREADGVATNRTNDTMFFELNGVKIKQQKKLGTTTNTYAPNSNQFNIDLDFRSVEGLSYWTEARKTLARQAASEWATKIKNRYAGGKVDTKIRMIYAQQRNTNETYSFKRWVDDIVIFVQAFGKANTNHLGLGGPNTTSDNPRISTIAIASDANNYSDAAFKQIMMHEIGHALGLVGTIPSGQSKILPGNPPLFTGSFTRSANGGNSIALSGAHPNLTSTQAVMAPNAPPPNGPALSTPASIDFALLADHAYSVDGYN